MLGSGVYQPYNLTGASVRFHLSDGAGVLLLDLPASFRNASLGQVRFIPTSTQTNLAPAVYRGGWQVTFASGTVQTIPGGNSYRPIVIG